MPSHRLPHDIDPYDSEWTATFERFGSGDGNGRAGKRTGYIPRGKLPGGAAASTISLRGKGAVAKLAELIRSRDMAAVQRIHERIDAGVQQGAGIGRAADAKLDAWLVRRWQQRAVMAFDPIWQVPVLEGKSIWQAKAAAHLWLAVEMGRLPATDRLAVAAATGGWGGAGGRPVELYQVHPTLRLCVQELDTEGCRQVIHACMLKRGFDEDVAQRLACNLAEPMPADAGPVCGSAAPWSMIEGKQEALHVTGAQSRAA